MDICTRSAYEALLKTELNTSTQLADLCTKQQTIIHALEAKLRDQGITDLQIESNTVSLGNDNPVPALGPKSAPTKWSGNERDLVPLLLNNTRAYGLVLTEEDIRTLQNLMCDSALAHGYEKAIGHFAYHLQSTEIDDYGSMRWSAEEVPEVRRDRRIRYGLASERRQFFNARSVENLNKLFHRVETVFTKASLYKEDPESQEELARIQNLDWKPPASVPGLIDGIERVRESDDHWFERWLDNRV